MALEFSPARDLMPVIVTFDVDHRVAAEFDGALLQLAYSGQEGPVAGGFLRLGKTVGFAMRDVGAEFPGNRVAGCMPK